MLTGHVRRSLINSRASLAYNSRLAFSSSSSLSFSTPNRSPTPSPSPASSNAQSAQRSSSQPAQLDWNTYFTLRRQRRLYERAAAIPSTLAGLSVGGAYFFSQEIDITQTHTLIGLDPVTTCVIYTILCGAGGLLLGPVAGNATWRLFHRRILNEMDKRDKAFYERIVRNRADASLNSFRNPVPDYYGEKIKSVAEYRTWLRKQREHQRKGTFGGRAEEE
ncbi:uncharacterized protein VTP21DRAFT_3642 [Calcarisporiella thermophila]|uniref:uncharacterized protein n=1 Tax=Calcarisporiella thermophila TaxID=911321 RepID=UPI0037443D4E